MRHSWLTTFGVVRLNPLVHFYSAVKEKRLKKKENDERSSLYTNTNHTSREKRRKKRKKEKETKKTKKKERASPASPLAGRSANQLIDKAWASGRVRLLHKTRRRQHQAEYDYSKDVFGRSFTSGEYRGIHPREYPGTYPSMTKIIRFGTRVSQSI